MTDTVTQEMTHDAMLPDSWEWARVEQLGDVVTGNTPSTKEQQYYGGSIPLFKPTDLNAGYWVLKPETTLTEQGAEKARVLPAKSILVTCIGATIGKTGLSQVEGATNQQINALVPSKGYVVSEYLYFAFISRLLQDQVLSKASSTTLPILNKSKFSQLKIPLPPLNEQRRIVEKIEELFTKLDAGVRSLKQAQALLKSYRRSVLKAAVEGELSRDWREAHRDELEPASDLLSRILRERRERWEKTQLAKYAEEGKKPPIGWRARYKEPDALDETDLPNLPSEWTWVRFDQVSERVTVGHVGSMKNEYLEDGVPFLRGQNVRENFFDPTGLRFVSRAFHRKLSKSSLSLGDLLVVRSGAVGTACVMPDLYEEANCSDLVIVKQPIFVEPHFMAYYMNSAARDSVRFLQVGIALTHFNTKSMAAMSLPLPPLEEQSFIVEEVERRLSVVDKLEATVEASLKQAGGLRQSILKQAFSGELVPQDPDDEPASALVERIREERQATKQKAAKKSVRARKKVLAGDQTLELFPEQGA